MTFAAAAAAADPIRSPVFLSELEMLPASLRSQTADVDGQCQQQQQTQRLTGDSGAVNQSNFHRLNYSSLFVSRAREQLLFRVRKANKGR